jgi:hypothetical protein
MDRSGSMALCKDDAEGGLNHFIEMQKKEKGKAFFTLVQFDTEYEFVHTAVPIKDVPHCELHPRGATALLDAVGRAIGETKDRHAAMKKSQRPGLVVFVILTDGQENSSREFTQKSQIKKMIEDCQEKDGWQFNFLAADQDAFAEAAAIGIGHLQTMSYDVGNTTETFEAMVANTTRMRCAVAAGVPVVNAYTPEERTKAKAGK